MKKVIITVDNSRIMDSLHKAYLKFTSPTGRSLEIFKKNFSVLNQKDLDLLHRLAGDFMVRFIGQREVTVNEMKHLMAIYYKQFN